MGNYVGRGVILVFRPAFSSAGTATEKHRAKNMTTSISRVDNMRNLIMFPEELGCRSYQINAMKPQTARKPLPTLRHDLPDQPLPARSPAPEEIKRIPRALQQRIPLDDPLPQRLHEALLNKRGYDLRLETLLKELVLPPTVPLAMTPISSPEPE